MASGAVRIQRRGRLFAPSRAEAATGIRVRGSSRQGSERACHASR